MDRIFQFLQVTGNAAVLRLEILFRTVVWVTAITVVTTVVALGISWIFHVQFHLFLVALVYMAIFSYIVYRNYPIRVLQLLLGIDIALDFAESGVTVTHHRTDGPSEEIGEVDWARTENLTTARRYLRLLLNIAAIQIFLLMLFSWLPIWVFPLKLTATFFLAASLVWYLYSKVGMDSALIPWMRPVAYLVFVGSLVAMVVVVLWPYAQTAAIYAQGPGAAWVLNTHPAYILAGIAALAIVANALAEGKDKKK